MLKKTSLLVLLGVSVLAGLWASVAHPQTVRGGLHALLPAGAFTIASQALANVQQSLGKLPSVGLSELSSSTAAAPTVRKCQRDAQGSVGASVEYSTEKCAPGSRELPMSQGTVSVMPAFRDTSAAPAPAASAMPTVRDLLVPGADANLLEQRIERLTNQ